VSVLPKLAFVILWFLISPLVIVSSLYLARQNSLKQTSLSIPSEIALNIKENPTQNNLQGQVLGVQIEDLRPLLVEDFLKDTPLVSYSALLVRVADDWGIDWRLMPAIAMKESQGGKTARAASFNAWGFENGRTNFGSWEQAIEIVAATLKKDYIAKGLTTPEQIMAVYAPPQLATGGKWARDINHFFLKLESL